MATVKLTNLEACLDQCAEDTGNKLLQTWVDLARRRSPFDKGDYVRSFSVNRMSGGNGFFTGGVNNSARHASYIEDGWVSQPGKVYTNGSDFFAIGDGVWGHRENEGLMCKALRDAMQTL